jgi:DNA-binding transcriptional regulator YiaG
VSGMAKKKTIKEDSKQIKATLPKSELESLLKTEDLAIFLNMSEKTLRNWRSRSPHLSPPWITLGRSVRYAPSAVLRWYNEKFSKTQENG